MKNTRGIKVAVMIITTFTITLNSRDVNANVPEVNSKAIETENQKIQQSEPTTINDEASVNDFNPLDHKSTMALMIEEGINEEKEAQNEQQEKELKLLATVIHAEAGICDNHEKLLVGTVVMNRIDSETFPNTLEEVVYQEGQFTSVNGSVWSELPTDEEVEIAQQLMNGYRECPSNVVFFSKKCDLGNTYTKTKWHEYGTE